MDGLDPTFFITLLLVVKIRIIYNGWKEQRRVRRIIRDFLKKGRRKRWKSNK